MEEWRPIPDFEEYDASTYGNIRRRGRVLKPQLNRYGYLCITLYKDGTKCGKSIHRLVALTFLLNPQNKLTVNHLDEVKTNNCLYNLEWATQSEQQIHSPSRSGTSGHRHIYQNAHGSWRVDIIRNRKRVYDKTFPTLEQAIAARDAFLQILQPE